MKSNHFHQHFHEEHESPYLEDFTLEENESPYFAYENNLASESPFTNFEMEGLEDEGYADFELEDDLYDEEMFVDEFEDAEYEEEAMTECECGRSYEVWEEEGDFDFEMEEEVDWEMGMEDFYMEEETWENDFSYEYEEEVEEEDEYCEGEIEEEFFGEEELEMVDFDYQIGGGLNSFGEKGGNRIKIKKDPQKNDLDLVQGKYREIPVHKKAKEAWEKMVAAARKDGFPHPLLLPTSGYRSSEKQADLFRAAVKKYGSKEAARKWVAPSGGSPHQSGRALDLNLGIRNKSENVSSQRRTKVYQWLAKNAANFGFYPYSNEPWHWEYNPTAAQEGGGNLGSAIVSATSWLQELVQKGMIGSQVFFALAAGQRDPNKLTNLVFFGRYPQRKGSPLKRHEKALIAEWLDIKRSVVMPILNKISNQGMPAIGSASSASTSSNVLNGQKLGRIVVDKSYPALQKSISSYQFTADDAVWLARLIEGEAGGRDDADNHAVVWAMFHRYAAFRHLAPKWGDFGKFMQFYSTTLQPILFSVGAAKRVWKNHKNNPIKNPVVVGSGNYKGTNIQRVQYKRHQVLQRKPWNQFSPTIQNLVIRILTGRIPNPGIGIASEFANTRIYYQNRYGKPTIDQWKIFTRRHNPKKVKWTWIEDKPNLDQMKYNAFFIDDRLKNVPNSAIKIVV